MKIFEKGRSVGIKHWLALLLSFVAAVCMWYAISVRDQLEAQLEVNIDYHGIPAGLVVTDGLISKITVRLRGPIALLRAIPQHRLNESVDLSHITKGVTVVPFTGESIGPALRAFEVVDIQPPRLVVRADALVERSVPLKVEVRSPLRGGALKVEDIKARPDTVILRGPESVLLGIDSLPVEITLDPKASDTRVQTSVILDTPSLVTASPTTVQVGYSITSGRTVVSRRCRVAWAGSSEGLRLEPQEVRILVEVPEALARSADYLDKLKVLVTPPRLEPGQSRSVPIDYRLPDGMSLLQPAPTSVMVSRAPLSAPAAGQ